MLIQCSTDGMPIKSFSPNDKPDLTLLKTGSALETFVTALRTKPLIKEFAVKTTKFHKPSDIIVNVHSIDRVNHNITQKNMKELCLKKSTNVMWRINRRHAQPCLTYIDLFSSQTFEIPNDVESSQKNAENSFTNKLRGKREPISIQSFDGSEKSFARSQNDYYRSQMAVGDPIRAKRKKRALQE